MADIVLIVNLGGTGGDGDGGSGGGGNVVVVTGGKSVLGVRSE